MSEKDNNRVDSSTPITDTSTSDEIIAEASQSTISTSEYVPRHGGKGETRMRIPTMEELNAMSTSESKSDRIQGQSETLAENQAYTSAGNSQANVANDEYSYDNSSRLSPPIQNDSQAGPGLNSSASDRKIREENTGSEGCQFTEQGAEVCLSSEDFSYIKNKEDEDIRNNIANENSEARINFEDMAGEEDDDDDEPPRSGTKRALIAALIIIVVTAIGSIGFYTLEATRQKNEEEKNYKVESKADITYEYGRKVYLKPEAFINTDDMPESVKKTLKIESPLKNNGGDYVYNDTTKEVKSKGKKYLNEGRYTVNISYEQSGSKKYETVEFEVKDTIAPKFTTFRSYVSVCQNALNTSPADFMVAKDVNGVTYTYKTSQYDMKKVGRYTVDVSAKDSAGNETKKKMIIKVVSETDVAKGYNLTKNKYGKTKWSQGAKDIKNGKTKKDTTSDEEEKAKKLAEEKKQAEADAEAQAKKEQEEREKQNKTGWDGNKYYIAGQMLTGSQYVDGKWYYFDYGSGDKVTNQWIVVNGINQYYGRDGSRAEGFTDVNENGNTYTYYFGSGGVTQKGWLSYNGNQYYFDENGHQVFGDHQIDGKTYHFDVTTGAWDLQTPTN